MTDLTYCFAAVAVLAGLIASVSVWSPRRLGIKIMALSVTAVFLGTIYTAYAQLLSRPKPAGPDWWLAQTADASVLAANIHEGVGIYLWLQVGGAAEPRAYILPWNRDLAEQLQATLREAARLPGHVRMRLPFERALDDHEQRFYAMPEPTLPHKDLIDPPAQESKRQAGVDA
jgi:hypothetical protein